MSEQQAEQTAEAGASASHASDPLIDTVMASMQEDGAAASGTIAPDHEAPKADEPKAGSVAVVPVPRSDVAKSGMPDAAAYKFEPKVEPKAEAPRGPGKLMIMSPNERAWSDKSWDDKSWDDKPADPKIDAEAAPAPRKSRFAAMAAVAVLALLGGAIGGALATTGFAHVADATLTPPKDHALQASIARIDAEIQTLKTGLDHTSKLSLNEFKKATDRLDKIEKAQAEPAAKLARLSEAVDKLRAAPAVAPVAVAAATPAARERETLAKERGVTGSVAAPAGAAALPMPAAAAAPKSEPNRLPVVENWVLRDVGHGGALVEGRQGLYEVYAGDPLPGLGRVDGIRKQDGRWVVVTSRGLIVSR